MNKLIYLKLGILVCLVFLTGCKKVTQIEIQQPINVKTQRVSIANYKENLSYSGTIEESFSIPLSFSTMGTVSQVLVSEGAFVHQGQLLARLDSTSNLNAYKMAFAAEQQAKDAYKRLTPMHKNNTIPEIKFVEVTTRLEQAHAAAEIAKKNLADCNLYATTSGYVGKRSIEPGMIAMPNLTSITLVKIDTVYARISIPENEITKVKKGERALIYVRALGSKEFIGSVEEIGVVGDLLAHTYKIKIAIKNNGNLLKPGMVCNAVLSHNFRSQVVAISNSVIMVDETGNQFVYVVDPIEKKAIRKNIKTGAYLQDGIEVTSGLNKDDLLVIEGQQKLSDQANVKIINQKVY